MLAEHDLCRIRGELGPSFGGRFFGEEERLAWLETKPTIVPARRFHFYGGQHPLVCATSNMRLALLGSLRFRYYCSLEGVCRRGLGVGRIHSQVRSVVNVATFCPVGHVLEDKFPTSKVKDFVECVALQWFSEPYWEIIDGGVPE